MIRLYLRDRLKGRLRLLSPYLREHSANSDTVRIPYMSKCVSQRTLAGGLTRGVLEYGASALTTRDDICNIALDIFDPTEKTALHSGTLSTFCVVND
jgi:hypothetical protein